MKCNNFKAGLFLIFLFGSIVGYSQTFLQEGFEGGMPTGWTQQYDSGTVAWTFQNGGFMGEPPAAHSGVKNAYFIFADYGQQTKLITKPINISSVIKPQLEFYRCMPEFGGDIDVLTILYKVAADSAWKNLATYSNLADDWTLHQIELPNKSSTYYIAFQATAKFGGGVYIDDVIVYEAETIPKRISSLIVSQASSDFVLNNTNNNPILGIKLNVYGNSGTLPLKNITFHSLNTNTNDLKPNGVKLYRTTTDYFNSNQLLAGGNNFSGDSIVFSNINYDLPLGENYLWLTYDVDSNAGYLNTLDAKIKAGRINIKDTLYPLTEQSPSGYRVIRQQILFDDFETDMGWQLTGEFQRDTARGLGGFQYGNSDPSFAFSGKYFLGTDITGLGTYLGDYEPGLKNNAYQAISPAFNCKYFKDVNLRFYRSLNVDYLDKFSIKISKNNGATWNNVWTSPGMPITENAWGLSENLLASFIDRDTNVRIMFCVDSTDNSIQMSGWNIDNFAITGNYISDDVGPVAWLAPTSGCGLSANSTVTVALRNFGGSASPALIPVGFSLNNGASWYMDTIYRSIPFGDTIQHTFIPTADFSTPGYYKQLLVKTFLPSDEDNSNDTYKPDTLFSVPTYVAPYTATFEQDSGFWEAGGTSVSWQCGIPAGIPNASPTNKVWKTTLNGSYNANEISYIESPCFDLSNIDFPMISFDIWHELEHDKDGLALLYSTDEGDSWDTLGKQGDLWNWYNSSSIPALNAFGTTVGFTDTSSGWLTAQRFLLNAGNVPLVKFRFVFAADSVNQGKGVAIDNFSIFNIPPDAGAVGVLAPDSSCFLGASEKITVALKNYGLDTIESGTIFQAGYFVNGVPASHESFQVLHAWLPQDTIHATFFNAVNMADSGDYYIKAYTQLPEDNNLFAYPGNNDTSESVVVNFKIENFSLGMDFGSLQPDTIVLDAGPGWASYLWSTGATTQTTGIPDAGIYHCTVHNQWGCSKSDTIQVFLSAVNLIPDSLISPVTSCSFNSNMPVIVHINNTGNDTLSAGSNFTASLYFENNLLVVDTINLLQPILPYGVLEYQFSQTVNLLAIDDYDFKIIIYNPSDIRHYDDTLEKVISVEPLPVIDFGQDTIFTSMPDTLDLSVGSGYAAYLWQDGSTNAVYQVTSPWSQWYWVTITNNIGCQATDSVYVFTNDVAINQILFADSQCLNNPIPVSVELLNIGPDILEAGQVFHLQIATSEQVLFQDFTLNNFLLPGEHLIVPFVENIIFNLSTGLQNIQVSLLNSDVNDLNNQMSETITIHPLPMFAFNPDTIYSDQPVLLDAGNSYSAYLWNTGDTTQSITIGEVGVYWAEVYNEFGCAKRDSIHVFYESANMIPDSLFNPKTSCDVNVPIPVIFSCNNISVTAIAGGSEFYAELWLNNNLQLRDTFMLSSPFMPFEPLEFQFNSLLTIGNIGIHHVTLITRYPADIDHSDDTLRKMIVIYPSLAYSLGADTIITGQADTLLLDAGDGYASYLWQNGTTARYFDVTLPLSKLYSVLVTDTIGCVAKDSVLVYANDIAMQTLTPPATGCQQTLIAIRARFCNSGPDTIAGGTMIAASYQIDNLPIVTEAFNILQPLLIDSCTQLQFFTGYLAQQAGTHQIRIWKAFPDHQWNNDTAGGSFTVFAKPNVYLGADTIFTKEPDTIVLDAGAGFLSYLWQDNSIAQTFNVSDTGWYWVRVTDANLCEGADTVYIALDETYINQIMLQQEIMVYPNPAKDMLYIDLKNADNSELQLQLLNQHGVAVWETSRNENSISRFTIPVGNLERGIYYFVVHKDGKMGIRKVVLQ